MELYRFKIIYFGNVYLAIDNAECNPNTIREIIPTLLAQVPNLTVVMTSAFPIELEEESTLFLTHINNVDAMIIFYHQARLVDPDFALMKGEHQKLLNIVRIFDGNPTAIKGVSNKLQRFSFERLHKIICQHSQHNHKKGLFSALSLTWLSLPSMAKNTIIQLLFPTSVYIRTCFKLY